MMNASANLYKMLQIDPEADPDVVTAAYRRLSRKYHPDVSRDARSERRMQELNRAYEVLRDPVQRAAYDREIRGVERRKTSGDPARPAREANLRKLLGAPIVAGFPSELDLGAVLHQRGARRTLKIRNAGGGFLSGRFTSHAAWLSVSPASFQSNAIEVEVVIEPRALLAGNEYHARLDLAYDDVQTFCHVRMAVTTWNATGWLVAACAGISVLLLGVIGLLVVLRFG